MALHVTSVLLFRRGPTPQCPVTRLPQLIEDPTICFTTSSLWVCLRASYNVSLLSRHSSCLLLCPLMLLSPVLSFPRHSCCLAPRSFIPLLQSRLFCPLFSIINPLWLWHLLCRNGTTGHPSTGGSQLLPGPTIAVGPFLRLLVVPYGYMPVPISVLQCSDSFHL
jgi:hypothetical protein